MKAPLNIPPKFVSRKLLQLAGQMDSGPAGPDLAEQLQAGSIVFLRARYRHLLSALSTERPSRSEIVIVSGIVLVFALQIHECLIAEDYSVDSGFAVRAFRGSVESRAVPGGSGPFEMIAAEAESFANSLMSASKRTSGAKLLLRDLNATCLASLQYERTDAVQLAEVETAISTICQTMLRLGGEGNQGSTH
jgi:hypothetical protein